MKIGQKHYFFKKQFVSTFHIAEVPTQKPFFMGDASRGSAASTRVATRSYRTNELKQRSASYQEQMMFKNYERT